MATNIALNNVSSPRNAGKYGGNNWLCLLALQFWTGIGQMRCVRCTGPKCGSGFQVRNHLGRHNHLLTVLAMDDQDRGVVDSYQAGEGIHSQIEGQRIKK
jgi:hypothetical protein